MQTLIKDVMAVEDGRIVRTDLWIDGDTIAAADTRTPDRVIDGTGLTAVPGFIDTHIHGFGGKGTEDGTAEAILTMSDELASEGVTAFFPTIYTDTMERMLNDERAIVEAKGRESGAAIGGIHVEGPFISPGKIGAQNPLGRQDPSLDTFHKILSEGKGLVKAMTCAPELPGIGEIARAAEKEGVVLLMGHTDATYDEAMRGVGMGIRHTTHLFNAMSGLMHRYPGVVGAALMHDEVNVEIIGDGKHVHKDIIMFVIRTKGTDKVAIITDSLRPTNQREGVLTANGVEVEMGDGLWVTKGNPDLIQGSSLTMHKAFRNLVGWGLTIPEASAVTSTTPARIYGLKGMGCLRQGYRADIVLLDSSLGIRNVFIGGEMRCGTAN